MKVLVYQSSSLANPSFGVQIDEALNEKAKGNEVYFCYCSGLLSCCSSNPEGKGCICEFCKYTTRKTLKKFNLSQNSIPLIKLKNFSNHSVKVENIDDLKNISYKGVDLGYAMYSYYCTITRESEPDFKNAIFAKLINYLYNDSVNLVDSLINVVNNLKPDKVIVFNGRFFEMRPLIDICKCENISFLTTEVVGGLRTKSIYKIKHFKNTIPHDLLAITKSIIKSWELGSIDNESKKKIGESFFEKRRSGIPAGDVVYTEKQEPYLIPDNFDKNKLNIVFFNSSDDEIRSVSKQVDSLMLFNSQIDGIRQIISIFDKDKTIHFYLRIHPNLFNLKLGLDCLRVFNNITIIPPDSPISSYSLLDCADKVVVFGSTIGIEAIYWGKPAILLSAADYYYLDVCEKPKTLKQIENLIRSKLIVTDKAKQKAIKYGYWVLCDNTALSPKYLSLTPSYNTFLGKNIYIFKYLDIIGNSFLYKVIQIFIFRIAKFMKSKVSYSDRIFYSKK